MTLIALIGPMGAGKTTVGRALAETLGLDFIDTDELITQASGASVSEIFDTRGESEFRRFEEEAVRAAFSKSDRVVACGGGVVLSARNREALAAADRTVYIKVSPEVALARLGEGSDRPLLRERPTFDQLAGLISEREPIYERAADLVVDGSGEAGEIVKLIVEVIRT